MTERQDPTIDDDFGASGMRLDLREWLAVIALSALVMWIVPTIVSERVIFELPRPESPGATTPGGYRVPYGQSEDYWHYERWCEKAQEAHDVLVIGDSVVWGEYVAPGHSLASKLARIHKGTRFANLGVNGIHPAAMAGLLHHHASAIANSRVILHCNLLWMSSPKHDLRGEDEFRFNHARLVPQIWTRIPCYRADGSERLGIAFERHIDFWNWVRHVRFKYFDSQDLHHWTLTHPEWKGELIAAPEPMTRSRHDSRSWIERKIRVQDLDWVTAMKSFQWEQFQRCVDILRSRNNRILIVIGPFNEHMLGTKGLARFRALRRDVEAWLMGEGIEFVTPDVLPTEMYADASHPLEDGYVRLAESVASYVWTD